MILSNFINYQPLTYQDYHFSPLANGLGICFALSAAAAIPIVAVYKFVRSPGTTVLQVAREVNDRMRVLFRNGSAC